MKQQPILKIIVTCKQCKEKFEHWKRKVGKKKEYCARCYQRRQNEGQKRRNK